MNGKQLDECVLRVRFFNRVCERGAKGLRELDSPERVPLGLPGAIIGTHEWSVFEGWFYVKDAHRVNGRPIPVERFDGENFYPTGHGVVVVDSDYALVRMKF